MKTRPMKRNKNNQRASSLPFDTTDLLQHLFRLIKVGKMKDVQTWPHPLNFWSTHLLLSFTPPMDTHRADK